MSRRVILLPCSDTEAETSDEEFVAKEEDGKDSDACSDLDEEEEEKEKEKEEEEEKEEEDEEEEEGCDIGGHSSDESSDCFSDDEDLQTFTRLSRKAPRMLDSDDEETRSVQSERTSNGVPPATLSRDTDGVCSEAGLGDSKETIGSERATHDDRTNRNKRRPSVLLNPEEASMGPLVFESFESEESDSVDSVEAKMNGNGGKCDSNRGGDPLVALAGPASLDTAPSSSEPPTQATAPPSSETPTQATPPSSSEPPTQATAPSSSEPPTQATLTSSRPEIEEPVHQSSSSVTAGPPDDSGVGGSLEEDSRTQPEKQEESSIMMADSSLEMSFHWEQSLPPAQPRRNDSLELFTVAGTDSLGSSSLPEKVSWWMDEEGE